MSPNVRLLRWISFFSEFRVYGPFAVIYYAQVVGSYTLAMSVFAAAAVTSALMELPSGLLSDGIGRKPTLLLGSFCSVAGVVLLALAQDASLLLLGGMLGGVASALFSGNNDALLYESLALTGQQDTFHHEFGGVASMAHLALSVAALVGGIAGIWSIQLVIWLSVPPMALAFVLALMIEEPRLGKLPLPNLRNADRPSPRAWSDFVTALRHVSAHPRLVLLMLAQAMGSGIGEARFQFRPAFFGTLWPLWALGVLHAAGDLIASAGFRFSGRIIDRFGHLRVLIAGNLFGQAAGLLGVWLANVLSPVIMTATSFTYGASTTAQEHLLQMNFTDEQRATLRSLAAVAASLFMAVVSVGLGWVGDAFDARTALGLGLLMQLVVLPVYIVLFKAEGRAA